MGSSRDNEARGFSISGKSVASTGGVVAVGSKGIEYVGDFGAGELSLSTATGAGGFFSTGGTTIGGAVIERLGVVRPVIAGETPSPEASTVDSRAIVEVGLCRVMPWARLDSLSFMLVGERASFLEPVGVTDRTAGDGPTETVGELLSGELVRDLMSMRGLGGKLLPEPHEVELPGLRG